MLTYLPGIILITILAAVFHAEAVLTIFYLIVGLFLTSRWISRAAFTHLSFEREFTSRAFLNQSVPVTLKLANRGLLPVIWLQLHESLPVELTSPNFFRKVLSLNPHNETTVNYSIPANKRGYHPIGPAFLSSGDILGLSDEISQEFASDYLTVFPKVVPLSDLSIPSQSPFGTVRYHQPMFEDPSRMMGKRDYQVGDSIRKVDWKTSAATGKLQVKLFEASITLDTMIYLDMQTGGYETKTHLDAVEQAIVVASSIANWVIRRKQCAGLCTNGFDPILERPSIHEIPSRKGTGHLMIILETLARIQASIESPDFLSMVRQSQARLAWGSTIILITGHYQDDLFNALFQARKVGLSTLVCLVGVQTNLDETRARARYYGIPLLSVNRESDMDFWR